MSEAVGRARASSKILSLRCVCVAAIHAGVPQPRPFPTSLPPPAARRTRHGAPCWVKWGTYDRIRVRMIEVWPHRGEAG